MDKRVGTRDMDVRDPGADLPGIDDPELGGVLKLGGALRVPQANFTDEELEVVERYENWAQPYPHPFQQALAALRQPGRRLRGQAPRRGERRPSGLTSTSQGDPDPLITAPLYGRWHALTQRLLDDRDGTPVSPERQLGARAQPRPAPPRRGRVRHAASCRHNQEDYMDAAWEQIGDVLEANRRIRSAQLAKLAAASWYARELQPLRRRTPGARCCA